MMVQNLFGHQSIIVTLDVDKTLTTKLNQLKQMEYTNIELNCADPVILSNVIQAFPTLQIGAGNVTNTQQLENCYQAGARFVTSPGFLASLAHTASVYSVNYIPGIATISEALQAINAGCQYVRPYPASIHLCTYLHKSLPDLHLLPAEIELDDVEHYLNLPSVIAVSLLNPDLHLLNQSVFA